MRYFSTFSGIGGFERGIIQAWKKLEYAQNVNNQESFTKVEVRGAKNVMLKTQEIGIAQTLRNSKLIRRNGDNKTQYGINSIKENSDSKCEEQYSTTMEASVGAAGNQTKGFSSSIMSTTMEQETGNNTGQAICTNSQSREGYQIPTKSSATTAITENKSTEFARTKPEFVGYSEIDKYARSVYEKHYPEVPAFGDITKINAEELPDFDCLVGGFPCQAFSIAGKRKGFEDTRGTLFFDLARILRAKRPRLFVFENVKGLLSHDNGNTFKTIIATIDELGYDCQWQVLNSKDFGVPQNRERVYIVGHLRGTPRPEVFPITGNDSKDIEVSSNVPQGAQGIATRHLDRNGGLISPIASTIQVAEVPHVVGFNRNDGVGKQLDAAHTLSSSDYRGLNRNQNQNAVIDDMRIRRLTPIECERLQGFPDNWTAEGVDDPISDTQRYKMCGNAVTTNVIQAVFERLFDVHSTQNS